MENKFEFKVTVDGKPIALGRPRFRRIKKGVMCYNLQATAENEFKKSVKDKLDESASNLLSDLMVNDKQYYVGIECLFYIPTAKADSKKTKQLKEAGTIKPTTRPDIDNYAKFVLDSLHDVIYKDDNCVTDLTCKKRYSETGRTELIITIEY